MKLFSLSRKPPVVAPVVPQHATPACESEPAAGYWSRFRRPRPQHELVLSGWTRAWSEALPEHVRPNHVASCHPYIANSLALSWRDPVLTKHVFDDLLMDRRGGRKGFSSPVLEELLRLREFRETGCVPVTAPAPADS
jgi:hypothetical protein